MYGTEAPDRVRTRLAGATGTEKRVRHHLRNRRLAGHTFRRQGWIGAFIADFLCTEAMLVIEVDGSRRGHATDHDDDRTAFLEAKG